MSADVSDREGLTNLYFAYNDPGMSRSHANRLDLFINFGSGEERIIAGSSQGHRRWFNAVSFLDEDPAESDTRYTGLRNRGAWRRPFRGTGQQPHSIQLTKDEDGLVFYAFDRRTGLSSFLRNDEDEGPWGFDTLTIRLRDADREAVFTRLEHHAMANPIPGGLWLLGSALIVWLGVRSQHSTSHPR